MMKKNIKYVLEALNQNIGLNGSVIMTKDGIIIASDLKKDYKEDFLAAIFSSVVLTLGKSLKEIDTNFTRYVITTDNEKLILLDLGNAILLVIADTNINMSQINMAIFQAAAMIKKSGRIDIR